MTAPLGGRRRDSVKANCGECYRRGLTCRAKIDGIDGVVGYRFPEHIRPRAVPDSPKVRCKRSGEFVTYGEADA